MKGTTKSRTRSRLPAAEMEGPSWVASMHEYHSRTGLYRAEDLDRVLGDPREQVTGGSPDDFVLSCKPSDKR